VGIGPLAQLVGRPAHGPGPASRLAGPPCLDLAGVSLHGAASEVGL